MSLRAPTVPNYTSRIYFKKDFSEVENSITLGFDARINEVDNKVSIPVYKKGVIQIQFHSISFNKFFSSKHLPHGMWTKQTT